MYLAKSIAASGLRNQQTRIDVIAHNVANANSTAFKAARLDFKDAMYQTGVFPGPNRSPDMNIQRGHGLMVAGVGRDWRTGNFERTERPLDFALENEGFFSLLNHNGELVYTRNGSFHLSVEAEGTFLVNGEGLYVLDVNGARIMIPFGVNTINVATDGNMEFRIGDDVVGGATLGIFTFRNLTGLEAVGNGNFTQGLSAGVRLPADNIVVRQGILEGSNLNLSEDMTRLIRTQRAFQLSSRALTTADEMEGIANNMRR